MKKKCVQLGITMPFSNHLHQDMLFRVPLLCHPLPKQAAQYADALCKEIANCANDLTDCCIDSVRFILGDVDFLDPESFRQLMACIRRNFEVLSDAEITAMAFLSYQNRQQEAEALRAFAEENVFLMLDTPSLIEQECKAYLYPYHRLGLQNLLESMATTGLKDFGMVLLGDSEYRNTEDWEYLLQEILQYKPLYLEIEMGDKNWKSEGLSIFKAGLASGGYAAYAENCYGYNGKKPRYVLQPKDMEYLGVGLGARSCMDGYYTENIMNLQSYIAAAEYYEHIIAKIEPRLKAEGE